MGPTEESTPRSIPAVVLIHQEGVIGVIALVGLSLRSEGLFAALAPRGPGLTAIFTGLVAGVVCAGVFWVLRRMPALADLEAWQRHMVRGWSVTDAAAVAVFSGLAEEALLRALLQPLIGLFPAALRRLLLWPVAAFVLGVSLGKILEFGGYPAAAAAHITINAFALFRLQRAAME
jgi:hypothetical protein